MNDTKLKCIRRVKKKIGDVIEDPTSKGLVYVLSFVRSNIVHYRGVGAVQCLNRFVIGAYFIH